MKIIYLEPDEEITSVVERLRALDDPEVAIVVPKRAGLLQSIINLKLLRHQSEQMKKRLSIVTTDKTGRNLASAVGLTVYQKLPEGSEVIDSAVKEPGETPVPVTIKKPPAPRTKVKAGKKEPISYKGGKGPVVTRALPDNPVDALEARAAEVGLNEAVQKPGKAKPKAAPKMPGRPNLPKMTLPALTLPKVNLPKLQVPNRGGLIALIAVAVLLLGFLIPTYLFASADITITTKTTPVSADLHVVFSAHTESVDANANIIPAKTIDVVKDTTVEADATGRPPSSDRAKGTITIANKLSQPQSLLTRTRFVTPDGKVFRIQGPITVPAQGSVQATVIADDPGSAGESPAGVSLVLAALPNSAITGVTASAIKTPKSTSTQVSEADIDRARKVLIRKAIEEGLGDARGKLAVGYKLDDQTVATTIGPVTPTPPQGAETKKFTLSGTVSITYFTYQDEVLQKVINEDLAAKTPSGSQLLADKSEIFKASQTSGDTVTGVYKINAAAAATVPPDQLKQDIAGQSRSEAERTLRNAGGITDVAVSLSPPWIRHIPSRLGRIHITFSNAGPVSSPSPKPKPTPTPTPTPTPATAASAAPATRNSGESNAPLL